MVNGRPRKTQEELDKEMEDYWGSTKANREVNGAQQAEVPAAAVEDDDIDMII
jgi:THO complex subunit 4